MLARIAVWKKLSRSQAQSNVETKRNSTPKYSLHLDQSFKGTGMTVSRLLISTFNGEGFDVCPSLCSGNGVCEASGSCKCADGYRDSDCSDEVCIGGCGVHGKCDLKKRKCSCDIGFAGEKCEKEACPNKCSRHGECDEESEIVNATRTGKEWIVRYRIVQRIAAIMVRVPIPQRDLYVPVNQNGVAIIVILQRAQLAKRPLINNALGTVSVRVESASAVLDIQE